MLASRFSSCIRKSRRRPAGSVGFEHAQRLATCAEALELLVHVHLVGQQHQFLLEAFRVHLGPELCDALAYLCPDARTDLRQPRPHQRHPGGQALAALAKQFVYSRAFALARLVQFHDRFAQQCERLAGERCQVAFCFTDDARPAQDVERAHRSRDAAQHAADVGSAPEQLLHHRAIQLELRCRGDRRAQVDARLDLAAAQLAAEQLAHVALEAAQVFRQPRRDLEIAVVHRAQFAGQGPPGSLALASGKARHAANHGVFRAGVVGLKTAATRARLNGMLRGML